MNQSNRQLPEQFLEGITILIAEDEEFNYRYLDKLIRIHGGEVIWARTGEEVVDLVSLGKQPDLILMDIKMPVMDGYDASRKVKALQPQIPIIAQTAFALYGDNEQALEAGCDDYISKPIMLADLIVKLKLHLKINNQTI